ncbi:MAG: response regulator [Luteolibacter sp.]|uniref:response regulator transcription factor n=1 Tax=Luteolibacter sp. TaxID=1962973 RepID=UPI0032631BC1
MPAECHTIYVIDDDASIRRALGRVMTSAGYAWESFDSADQFLARTDLAENACIVADMALIGMSGLELQQELNARHYRFPVIFLTAEDSEEIRNVARNAGAAGFFRKPVDTQALLDAIDWALHEPQQEPSEPDSPLV